MKTIHNVFFALLLLLALVTPGFARQGSKDDDAQQLIKWSSFLEQKPLDKDAKDVRKRALTWIIATDKVSVKVCSLLLSGIDKKYKYGDIFGQYTIAMAAFKLANPDKAADEDSVQMAGVASALNSYEAIVKEQPKAKNSFMDDLLSKRSDGTLAQYVAANNCKDKK